MTIPPIPLPDGCTHASLTLTLAGVTVRVEVTCGAPADSDDTPAACPAEISAPADAAPVPAPEPSTDTAADTATARRRALAAARQRRYRERHAALRNAPVTRDVTPVTQKVTPVTRYVTQEDVCVLNNNINNINNNTHSQTQPSVTRHASRNAVTRDAPGMRSLPLTDALPEVLDTPDFRTEWDGFVLWRQSPGMPTPQHGYWARVVEMLEAAARDNGLRYAVGMLHISIARRIIHTLWLPDRATLDALQQTADRAADLEAERAAILAEREAHQRAQDAAAAQRDLDARLRAVGYIPDTRAWTRGQAAIDAEEIRRQAYLEKLA